MGCHTTESRQIAALALMVRDPRHPNHVRACELFAEVVHDFDALALVAELLREFQPFRNKCHTWLL